MKHSAICSRTMTQQNLVGESVEWLEDQINEFYSIDDQKQDGVIGIEFELV